MKKNYVLDTNVLLHDPTAALRFEDNHVVIPLKVIEEIDSFKRDQSELGRNARQVSRMLDEHRQRGKLSEGVTLSSGGVLQIAFPGDRDHYINGLSADDQILKMARELRDRQPDMPCIVVSKDINLRLKADALGLDAEDYEASRVDVTELYSGQTEYDLTPEQIDELKREGRVPADLPGFSPNQYVHVRGSADAQQSFLARYDGETKSLVTLIGAPDEIRPVHPRNKEQHYAMDALLNDAIKVVTIIGKAGTGKTLLAVAAGLFKTMDQKAYRKLLVCRPTIPMGKDIGFLPGTLEEKLNPWMQPIFDALDLISTGRRNSWRKGKEGFADDDRLGVEPLTYIRGRSIPNQYIIVDEAQNLTPLEVKTVLTRVGPGTKIVLTGDIYQIDNPYVDSMSNGLTYVVERFRPYPVAAHILLTKGVRSEVAELAANLL
jgi:PhoH-like ATPase